MCQAISSWKPVGKKKEIIWGDRWKQFDKDELAYSSNQSDANKNVFAFMVKSKILLM